MSKTEEWEIAYARMELACKFGWARGLVLGQAIGNGERAWREELARWDAYAVQRKAVPQ